MAGVDHVIKNLPVGAGISDWISDYGLADIARTKETEFYGAPWDPKAREIMIPQSPLTYANRVKAATLFIHGEKKLAWLCKWLRV
jgi:dipeptidyl aminopeptidase/acylaminoacyl peptidase